MKASAIALGLLAALAGAAARAQESPTSPPSPGAAPAPAPPPAPPAPAPTATKPVRPNPPPAANDKQRIEINGRRDATEQRRLSTAAKIIVTREDIEQFGDTSLADVIKRLPSVTVAGRPGRGGQIRMRGMGNGYTQILIDGERLPPGFAIDQISPDQIERIEILRAPTAETGARAIAGTINIILREPLRQRGDDLRLGLSSERGRLQPNASWTRNDVLGETGTYNLNAAVTRVDQRTDTRSDSSTTDATSGATLLQQHRESQQVEHRNTLHLNGRVQWQLGGGDQFSVQPFVNLSQGHTHTQGTLTQPAGVAPYDDLQSDSTARNVMLRLALAGRKRLGDSTRLELRGYVGSFQSTTDSLLTETSASVVGPVLVQGTNAIIHDRSWNLTGKLSHTLLDRHSMVAGLESEGVQRSETGLQSAQASNALSTGTPTAVDVDGDLQASTRRLAAYVQDEWEPSAEVSAYAGLRWETIRTRSAAATLAAPVSNTGTVLTPLAHAVWRFNAPARDQLRFSLTRSYRPPTLGNLTSLPRFNTTNPVPGPNTAITPDRAGNPDLRPELARGLDIALEHYLPAGGVLSASVFSRHINDLIRNVTALEGVPWAAVPRWVNRPQNIGDANTQGIELDGKLRLDEVMDQAPPLSLRGNLGLYRSQVSGIPGPNNRIDSQPHLSFNGGGDYRLRSLPLTLGANLSLVPGYTVQQTTLQSQTIDTTRVLDAFVLWTVNPTLKLRLSLSNIVPKDYITGSTILAGGQQQTVVSDGPTYRVVALRLEMKL